ncbi:MFS transporter [Niabella drilacis]|uniref:Major Facilitator Superfamily protein n=1 Tax=Niabella drilacis (strain DSM 25811 / CCM 8410 / CCUG 62505 / LMG 26954 / E90) TaxID=1285928 RepID=A0A1G6WJN4_NIADE|nr:MFS transporter [Niabella drilacis]SDD65275.1 Major Facilitator Superfamily protein [Niabella drilacis]
MNQQKKTSILSLTVVVAALGYFVDIYDLLIFGIIRIPSLKELGLTADEITTKGEWILSAQMAGLLIGGILWGIWGDKKGRVKVLFGSILIYSIANICNGFVQTVEQYTAIRFLAGIGLAGELGAGITLVAELLPKEKRGIGTSIVAGFGVLGAAVAFLIKEEFHWRTCYFIGGGLGILLLLLRISVLESGMYHRMNAADVKKGRFLMLFSSRERFTKYIKSIFIGLPTWLVIGILITFSSEFGKQFGITGDVDPGRSIMYAYIGLALGDITIGLVSQWLKSRKKALYIFYALTFISMLLYFTTQWNGTPGWMYTLCFFLGFSIGFWAIFVTVGAEQFGTNLRATAATTVPNFVRGLLPLILLLFKEIRGISNVGYVNGAIITSAIVMAVSTIAVITLPETFHKDLNYEEL